MNKNAGNKKLKFVSTLLFPILFLTNILLTPAFCQMPELSGKELKKLEKAKEMQTDAEDLQLEANEMYLEASVLRQDEEYDISKNLQKEAESLEKDAMKKEEKAADLFEEATETKKEIYKDAIKEFWKNFDGDESLYVNAKLIEETADEYFFRAQEIRRDASKIKDDQEAVLKQNEAYELELMAMEKLLTAYSIYEYGPSGVVSYPDEPVNEVSPTEEDDDAVITEPTVSPEEQIAESGSNVPPENGEVSVDQQQLEMIQGHLKRKDTRADSAATFHPEELVEDYDMESIKQSWDKYQSMDMPDAPNESTIEEYQPEVEEISEQEAYQVTEINEEAKPSHSDTPVEIGKVEETIVPDPNSVIIYKVELAADRAPIDQNVLKKLYYGDREVERINEGGWYKYSVGDFDTYEEADSYRKTMGVKDAFVVAYRGSKRLKDYKNETVADNPSINEPPQTQPIQPASPESTAETSAETIYVVQIAASKSPMQHNQLESIYSGQKQVKMRREEGWYKYQIGHTPNYQEAVQTLNDIYLRGAFITAYRGDEKVEVTRGRTSHNGISFMVQIAADKSSLTKDQLDNIYSGNKTVREKRENGWYKYQIVAGSTYNQARRLKNLLKINGSFVVAYQNGNKIDIRRAIEISR